jgi:hypothetical protein
MSPQQANQLIAVVALVLIVIVFVLVATGILPSLIAIILMVALGFGVRVARSTLIKP